MAITELTGTDVHSNKRNIIMRERYDASRTFRQGNPLACRTEKVENHLNFSDTSSNSSEASDEILAFSRHHDNRNGIHSQSVRNGKGRKRHRTRPRRCNQNNKHNQKASKNSKSQQAQKLTAEQQAQYVAMDCEMVGVGEDGRKSVLARVTVVDWNGRILLDEFIQPDRPVTDYRTFVSGITKEDLQNAMDLQKCRAQVEALLEGKILVGHALKNDLTALGVGHPWYMTRDTAKYEPFMKVRFDDGILWPRKLRDLCEEKLHKSIQEPGVPHSPYEDAVAALDLYKSVQTKWDKVMDYKINKTRSIEQQRQSLIKQ